MSPTTIPSRTTDPTEMTTESGTPEESDTDSMCAEDDEYKERVAAFCKELLFTVSLENVLCSQVSVPCKSCKCSVSVLSPACFPYSSFSWLEN